MFSDMAVPTLAVVENMSYYDCDNPACGKRHRPFGGAADGDAHAAELAEAHGLDARFTLPISQAVASGEAAAGDPESAATVAALAEHVVRATYHRQLPTTAVGPAGPPDVAFRDDVLSLREFSEDGASELTIAGAALRARDPLTGRPFGSRKRLGPAPAGGGPNVKCVPRGNYAVSINWGEPGVAESTWTFDVLRAIAADEAAGQ